MKTSIRRALLGAAALAIVGPAAAFGIALATADEPTTPVASTPVVQAAKVVEAQPTTLPAETPTAAAPRVEKAAPADAPVEPDAAISAAAAPYSGTVVTRDDVFDFRPVAANVDAVRPCAGAHHFIDITRNDSYPTSEMVPGVGGGRVEIVSGPKHGVLMSRVYAEPAGRSILHVIDGGVAPGLSYVINADERPAFTEVIQYRLRTGGKVASDLGSEDRTGTPSNTSSITIHVPAITRCDGLKEIR